MMGFFRRIIGSRIGAVLGILLLGMIVFAFAAGDIQNLSHGGSLFDGSGKVVTVGDTKLPATEVQSRVQREFENVRQQQPALTIDAFLSGGGFEGTLNRLINSATISEFARQNGMRVSKKLVDAQIASLPAFHDATGKFSQTQFDAILQRERVSEAMLRDDFTRQVLQTHLIDPVGLGPVAPNMMVSTFASMLLERRAGTVAIVPSTAFVAGVKPDEAMIRKYFAANAGRFALPEQRRMRYALVDSSRFAAKPSEVEIARYYQANAAQYGASDKRSVHQLILPTEAGARALAARIGPGLSLEAAAAKDGLAASKLEGQTRQAFAAQAGNAAAAAVFAARQGAVIGPIKTGLGWALYAVSGIQATPARSLDTARAEIAAKLATEKSRQALAQFTDKLDAAVADGATFEEVAKANGLTVAQTPLVTAQGQSIADPRTPLEPALMPLVTAGFAMDQDDDAQIVPVVPDRRIALVAVGQIVPAGPPPFAQARGAATQAYVLAEGAHKAQAVARTLQQSIQRGASVADAVSKAGIALPPAERLAARRAELGQQGQRVPPPMIALFSMRKGAVRVLPLPGSQGYLVLRLDQIQPGDAAGDKALLAQTKQGLNGVVQQEYMAQFVAAMRADVGVTRNEAALRRIEADMRKGGAAQ